MLVDADESAEGERLSLLGPVLKLIPVLVVTTSAALVDVVGGIGTSLVDTAGAEIDAAAVAVGRHSQWHTPISWHA